MFRKLPVLGKNLSANLCRSGVQCFRSQIFRQVQTKNSSNEQDVEEKLTHFGFETVNEDVKAQKVHKVFEDVANSYDLMNDIMSMGIQRLWKDDFMEELGPTPGTKLLDMAGGTGDIAFRYLKYLKNGKNPDKRQSHLTIGDINQHMLNVGKTRAEKMGLTNPDYCKVEWLLADAENLQFDDNTFSAYTISFGMRNCTHIDRVLKEAYRVLAPGGRFLCLEFTQVPNETLRKIYDFYSFEVIPPMGQILAGQWQPYQYLVESIRRFPPQEKFKEMIRKAGFNQVTHRDLTFGITAIHSGFKF
ncbi:2-methoxy-6-polyprenyl-1,4-benzoquinol methylase, mitochondrial [Sergentomyia squamirostris]